MILPLLLGKNSAQVQWNERWLKESQLDVCQLYQARVQPLVRQLKSPKPLQRRLFQKFHLVSLFKFNKTPFLTCTFLLAGICNFCKSIDGKEYELGELRTCEDITAHMYCLYFSPGLTQNGLFDEGINGFLLPDIRKELRRASQLRCSYCDQRSAAIGCGIASCHANFHLPCGLKNGVFTQFHDPSQSYPAYCQRHRPKLKLPSFKDTKMCTICQENIKFSTDKASLVFLSCCQTYFHRSCLGQLAYFQGELSLKCPNCLNSGNFITSVKENGICVPPRDYLVDSEAVNTASENVVWECCAEECSCENGRSHNGDNEWELFACDQVCFKFTICANRQY